MGIMTKTLAALDKVDRSRLALAGLALAVVTLLAVNVFSNAEFRSMRIDLTQDKLFTISPATRTILGSIDEPINIKLYFSRTLGENSPGYANYFNRVRELLEQYVDIANGKLRLELFDPVAFSTAEDQAVAFGLQGVPVTSAGDLGYFGLAATNSTDDQAIIPFFSMQREGFVEYDLTKVVHSLANPEKKVVGLLSTLPMEGRFNPRGGATQPWLIVDQIRQFFEVRTLEAKATEIPADVDILMLVNPKDLSDRTLYAIDQFVLGGGKALVFVDPNTESSVLSAQGGMGMGMAMPGESDFNRLLEKWGVKLVKGKIAGDLETARRVSLGQRGRSVVTHYVAWLALGPQNFDSGDVVTGDLGAINLGTPGILEPVESAGTKVTPLFTTSPRSMAMDTDKVRLGNDPVALLRSFVPGNKPLTLAARLTGTAKTAFPDGRPPAAAKGDEAASAKTAAPEKEKDGKDKAPPRSSGTINVIVVADTDLLHDIFWVDQSDFFGQRVLLPQANNADFVVNALDNLSGSAGLISLRGRGGEARTFHLVDGIRRDAERRYRTKEQQLMTKLEKVKGEFNKLQNRDGKGGDVILGPEEKASLDKFRQEMVSTRRELRDVKHALRSEIERLGAWLKFLNIAAVPLLLAAAAAAVALARRVRRARSGAEA